jgi:bifunctional DNase/RNase
LTKLVVSDLVENTFLSILHLHQGDRHLAIDARPSDGIALSLRAGTPIYVLQRVFEKAATVEELKVQISSSEDEDMDDEAATVEKKEWHM